MAVLTAPHALSGTKWDIQLLVNPVPGCGLAAKLGGGHASFPIGECGLTEFTPIFSA